MSNYFTRAYSRTTLYCIKNIPRFCSASGMFANARVSDSFSIIWARIASFCGGISFHRSCQFFFKSSESSVSQVCLEETTLSDNTAQLFFRAYFLFIFMWCLLKYLSIYLLPQTSSFTRSSFTKEINSPTKQKQNSPKYRRINKVFLATLAYALAPGFRV